MPSRSDPPLPQFAVVREDPALDAEVLSRTPARRALLVASGGCSAFALLGRFPALEITLVEPNPVQADLVRRKLALLRHRDHETHPARWNLGSDDPGGLCQRGNFERLFRQLRAFVQEFIAPRRAWEAFFERPEAEFLDAVFASPWWPAAFGAFFSDRMLETMFTAAATQHADPGSYPEYFRRAFERGLRRPDAADNPFLHHVWLGMYIDRPGSRPEWTAFHDGARDPVVVPARLEDVSDLSGFDFVGLSNVMDWMDIGAIDRLGRNLRTLRPGAAVLWRQLNNDDRHELRFGPGLAVDEELSEQLLRDDRSLFYNRVVAAFARAGG